jgi:hypothetical protein
VKVLTVNVAQLYDDFYADTGSLNYPALNILDEFLHKRFQSLALADRLTWDYNYALVDVDCFFYSFHTMTAAEVRLYNMGLLASHVINPIEASGAIYFAKQSIDELKLLFSGPAAPLYLGGCAFGEAYTMPDPLAEWEDGAEDNSAFESSPMGQGLQNYIAPLYAVTYSFANVDNATAQAIKAMFDAVGVGGHFWIDRHELNHGFRAPFYATLLEPVKPVKSGNKYKFNLKIREAR